MEQQLNEASSWLLAIIVEVAARNLSLKRTGYNAARELSSLFQDDANE